MKQKIVVPLLELLGHRRENLEFEHPTQGGRLDIYIKKVRPDCKVIIDTKKYSASLDEHIDQIKKYTFAEAALLTIIANGAEIRVYSPLRGIAFERSLLYRIGRGDLVKDSVWTVLLGLLHHDNLTNGSVHQKISEREQEIRDAMSREERVGKEYESKQGGINAEIEKKENEIEQLREEKQRLEQERNRILEGIWDALALPSPQVTRYPIDSNEKYPGSVSHEPERRARKVSFQELVDAGLIKDGQTIFLSNNKRLVDKEQVQVVAKQNKLRYKDDTLYTPSDLAMKLLKRHQVIDEGRTTINGNLHWQTAEGKTLDELNALVRQK